MESGTFKISYTVHYLVLVAFGGPSVYTRSKIRFNPPPKFILWLKEGYIWLFWAFDKKIQKVYSR